MSWVLCKSAASLLSLTPRRRRGICQVESEMTCVFVWDFLNSFWRICQWILTLQTGFCLHLCWMKSWWKMTSWKVFIQCCHVHAKRTMAQDSWSRWRIKMVNILNKKIQQNVSFVLSLLVIHQDQDGANIAVLHRHWWSYISASLSHWFYITERKSSSRGAKLMMSYHDSYYVLC